MERRIRITVAIVLIIASLAAILHSVSVIAINKNEGESDDNTKTLSDLVVMRTEFEEYLSGTAGIRVSMQNNSETTISPSGATLSKWDGKDWIIVGGGFSAALPAPIEPDESAEIYLCFDIAHFRSLDREMPSMFVDGYIQTSKHEFETVEMELSEGQYRIRDSFRITYTRHGVDIPISFPVYAYFTVR